MKNLKKNLLKKFISNAIIFLLLILIIIGCFAFYISAGSLSPLKEKLLRRFSVPLELVNSRPVYSTLVFKYADLLKFNAAQNDQKTNNADLASQALLLAEKKQEIGQLASRFDVQAAEKQLQFEYSEFLNNSESSKSSQFFADLRNNNLNEADFKSLILKPEIEIANLQTWFNGQASLNQKAYEKIQEIQGKINAGTDFGALAKIYSEDASSNILEGDLGFVESQAILPELLEKLDGMEDGQVQAIASRYGWHIIKLVEKDNQGRQNGQRLHLMQIFLKSAGFNSWLEQETKSFKIVKLINLKY